MRLNLRRAISAQPAIGTAIQKLCEQVFGRGGHDLRAGEMQRFREDLAVHLVGVFVVVRRQARQHFVEEHAQRPPVDGFGVALPEQEFGGEVFGGAAEG